MRGRAFLLRVTEHGQLSGMADHSSKGPGARFRGQIAPLADSTSRPLWSVMIPTFNCASYLSATLKCVLEQDPGPEAMQIQVVDDHSTNDDPLEVIRSVVGERVEFFRQQVNKGVVGNLNTCINRARGEIVHLLHGDDLVQPGYYSSMTRVFENEAELGAAFCRHVYIDDHGSEIGNDPPFDFASGIITEPAGFLGAEQRIMTPSISVRRRVYEELGGFDRRLKYAEDWEMWMRIASRYPVFYLDKVLSCYRMHENSNSGRSVVNAISDTHHAIRIFSRYFPKNESVPMRESAIRTYAKSALSMADRLIEKREFRGAVNQLWVALKMNCSADMFREVLNRIRKIVSDLILVLASRRSSS